MKKWLPLLALALLLTGCGVQEPAPSTSPEPSDTTAPSASPTQPTGETDSVPIAPTQPSLPPEIEDTALSAMDLNGSYLAVAPMGNDLLLFEQDRLSLWSFGGAEPMASAQIPALPLPDSGLLQVLPESVVYFDSASCSIIYLNEQLQQTRALQLNEPILGDPYLAQDGSRLYFCTASGIRFWEAESGICRNLKVQEGNWIGITGSLLEETALRCQLTQPDGSVRTLLISAQTGQTLWEGDELNAITGSGTLYCYPTETEWIFGQADQQPQVLHVEDPIALPRISAAMTLQTAENNLVMELYDLASGRRTAAAEVPGAAQISGLTAFDGHIWFFADSKLYRWDPAQSPVEDENVYTSYRFSADAPDLEGLAAFQAKAKDLSQRYGIEILMWQDAAAAEPAGYTFALEHRTHIYEAGFARLEAALAQFPDSLPDRAADWTEDGTLRIVLVQSITTPSETAYSTLSGMEYLLDGKVYIVLALDENLEQSLYHALFHVIDPLVMSNSIAYYKWNDLNPSGFRYDNDYLENLNRDGSEYLEDNRYFIDTYSMSYAVEDRARIFEYAIMPGNESYFQSKPMQAKLKMLCNGLRDVFELEEESYIWEQYLT